MENNLRKKIIGIVLILLTQLNCVSEKECNDAKRIGGVKKEVICATLNLLGAREQSNYTGRPIPPEQAAKDAFYSDLRLLLVGNCIHPSKPTDSKCNGKIGTIPQSW